MFILMYTKMNSEQDAHLSVTGPRDVTHTCSRGIGGVSRDPVLPD